MNRKIGNGARIWVAIALMMAPMMPAMAKGAANKTRQVQAANTKLTVGSPLTQGNMTVFPVYGGQGRKVGSAYLTLGEALKKQLIAVKELPDAEVNRVSVTSRSSRPMYLMAGEIILGGQQDREIARDTIVPAKAQNFAVEVFCVEHGRWSGARHFGGDEIASSALRRETQSTNEQQKVWDHVAKEAADTSSQSASGTYRAVGANKNTQQQLAVYTKTLGRRLARDRRALGLIVAINGKVTAADVFADPQLFQQQMPKVLKSYALDAAQNRKTWNALRRKPRPSLPAARQLLKDADSGTQRTVAASSATINRQRENSSTVTFDAAAPAANGPNGPAGNRDDAMPAHRNIYRK